MYNLLINLLSRQSIPVLFKIYVQFRGKGTRDILSVVGIQPL